MTWLLCLLLGHRAGFFLHRADCSRESAQWPDRRISRWVEVCGRCGTGINAEGPGR